MTSHLRKEGAWCYRTLSGTSGTLRKSACTCIRSRCHKHPASLKSTAITARWWVLLDRLNLLKNRFADFSRWSAGGGGLAIGKPIVLRSGYRHSESQHLSRPSLNERRTSDHALLVPYIRPPSMYGVISFSCRQQVYKCTSTRTDNIVLHTPQNSTEQLY